MSRVTPPTPHEHTLEYRGVSFSYPGADTPALTSISFAVHAGERLGILGPNGGGKSTLLKLTLGLLDLQAGEVRVCGRSPREARREGLVGYVPQKVDAELAFPLSVRQVVVMPLVVNLAPWKRVPSETRRRADEALSMVGAAELADRPIGALSGGQLQRVMIARAIAPRPKLLLLDEPTVGIDVAGQRRFAELLQSLRERLGVTIVVVSHDIRTIAAGCDRVACLARTLHFHDAPSGLSPQVLGEVFRHDIAEVFGDVHVDAHAAATCHVDAGDHAHHHCCDHHGAPPSAGVTLNVSAKPASAAASVNKESPRENA
ncbi:MAG: metal ABC transporter ATP-binding protein [Phycisphaerae bacterium]|nr:metal ABC transporter ATP-binding protein [Phycisphaerae bacterium]